MSLNLCMLSIKVNDVEEAKEFYCNKLNFKVEKVYNECIIELSLDELPIIIEKVDEVHTVDYFKEPQVTLGLKTKDLILEMKKLNEIGVSFLFDEPQKCPPGIFNVIKDPSGNHIEILQFC